MFRQVVNANFASLGAKRIASRSIYRTYSNAAAMTFNRPATRTFTQTTNWWQQAPQTHTEWSKRQFDMLEDQEFNTSEEEALFKKLLKEYNPTALSVQDISGGCGSMYAIHITSGKFNDLAIIKQHQMVNAFLKEELTRWHGMQLITKKDKPKK